MNLTVGKDDDDSSSLSSLSSLSPPCTPSMSGLMFDAQVENEERSYASKRKRSVGRDTLLDEIPETPWQAYSYQQSKNSGRSSPSCGRLENQMSEMHIGGGSEEALVVDDDDELGDADRMTWSPAPPAMKKHRGEEPIQLAESQRLEISSTEAAVSGQKEFKGKSAEINEPVVNLQRVVNTSRRLKSPPPGAMNGTTDDLETGIKPQPGREDELSSDPDEFGIAYIPKTPAQREAKSQMRKRQIREYESRKSREARQKRIEARRRRRSVTLPVGAAERPEGELAKVKPKRVVHFNV